MEGVPRLPFLSFELKKGQNEGDIASALRKLIHEHFQENPDSFASEIRDFEGCRHAAINCSKDMQGCAALKRYFCQLQLLLNRLPRDDKKLASFTFTWTDIYAGITFSISDIKYEMASILYNIGSLHSQLGQSEERLTPEGMKIACSHFQCAAWAYRQVNESYRQPRGTDMSPDLMELFDFVCLAQAQECILEKSMVDNRRPGNTAKISAQIADHYKVCLQMLEKALKPQDDESLGEYIGPRLLRHWRKMFEFKMSYYGAITLLFQGMNAEELQKMGHRIAYYQGSMDKLAECAKVYKGVPEQEVFADAVSFCNDVIGGKLNASKKENDFVYHEVVPPLASLPEVKGASLAKGLGFDVNDPDVAGPDIFNRLISLETHASSSMYSEEKAKLLRTVSEKIESKDDALNQFMAVLQADELVLNLDNQRLPEELIERCASFSVQSDPVGKMTGLMSQLSELSIQVEEVIGEIGEILQTDDEKEAEYQKALGKRPPSMVIVEIRRELEKYKKAHAKASESNTVLHKAAAGQLPNLSILAKPLDEIQKQLPSLACMRNTVHESSIMEMDRLVKKVEEMKRQRVVFAHQLREALQSDDLTKKLATLSPNCGIEAFFKEEIKKHDHQVQLIEQNLSAQEKILQALSEANARFAETRRATNEILESRNSNIDALVIAYDAYEDLLQKMENGVDFYRKLYDNLQKLRQRTNSVFSVQNEEREQALKKLEVKKLYSEDEPSGGGRKLKDYLAARKGLTTPSIPGYRPSPLGAEDPEISSSAPFRPDSYPSAPISSPPIYRPDGASPMSADQLSSMYANMNMGSRAGYAPYQSYGKQDGSYPQPYQPGPSKGLVSSSQAVKSVGENPNAPGAYSSNATVNSYTFSQSYGNSIPCTVEASGKSHQPSYSPYGVTGLYGQLSPGTKMSPGQGQGQYTGNMDPAKEARGPLSQPPGYNYPGSQPVPHAYQGYGYPSSATPNPYVSSALPSASPAYPSPAHTPLPHGQQQQKNPTLAQSYTGQPYGSAPSGYASQPAQNMSQQYEQVPSSGGYHVQSSQSGYAVVYGSSQHNAVRYSSPQTGSYPNNQVPQPGNVHPSGGPVYAQGQVPQHYQANQYPTSYSTPAVAQPPISSQASNISGHPGQPGVVVSQSSQQAYTYGAHQYPYMSSLYQGYGSLESGGAKSSYSGSSAYTSVKPSNTVAGVGVEYMNTAPSGGTQSGYNAFQPSGVSYAPTQNQAGQVTSSTGLANQSATVPSHGISGHGMPGTGGAQSGYNSFQSGGNTYAPQQNQAGPVAPSSGQVSQFSVVSPAAPQNFPGNQAALGHQPFQPTLGAGYAPQLNQTGSMTLSASQVNQPAAAQSVPGSQAVMQTGYTVPGVQPLSSAPQNSSSGAAPIQPLQPTGGQALPNRLQNVLDSKDEPPARGILQPTPYGSAASSPAHKASRSSSVMSNADLLADLDVSLTITQAPTTQLITAKPSSQPSSAFENVSSSFDVQSLIAPATKTPSTENTKIDIFEDKDILSRFTMEVDKFEKFVDGLTKRSLSGPTPLELKWKEIHDAQDREATKCKISVARCYPMKNRQPDVLPFDHNRITLPSTKDDYINASRLGTLVQNGPNIIATQCPLNCTVFDFWDMVWEQQTEVIVCLLTDSELSACNYFPRERTHPVDVGSLSVALQSTQNKPLWVERVMQLTNKDQKTSRYIVHLQFTQWGSTDFPSSPMGFLSFINEYIHFWRQQRVQSRPAVVHCLAGAGKTGAFVTVLGAVLEAATTGSVPDVLRLATAASLMRRNILRDRDYLQFAYRTVLACCLDVLRKHQSVIPETNTHFSEPVEASVPSEVESASRAVPILPMADQGQGPSEAETHQETSVPPPTSQTQFSNDSPVHGALHSALDPAQFTLGAGQGKSKKQAMKERFMSGQTSFGQYDSDPSDPFSDLDPLWSLKKS